VVDQNLSIVNAWVLNPLAKMLNEQRKNGYPIQKVMAKIETSKRIGI
jgi:hypothetical protein